MTIMPLAQGEQCFEYPRILKITESTINQYQCCRGQTSQAPRSRAKKRLLKQRVSMFPKQMMIHTFFVQAQWQDWNELLHWWHQGLWRLHGHGWGLLCRCGVINLFCTCREMEVIWETGKSVVVGVFLWGALLSWKWLQTTESDMVNYQKRYLAIAWNTICSFMFACKAWNCSFFPNSRQSESDTRSDTLAIPFWYINAHKSILPPHHGFPLVEFQLWTRKKRSRDVRHTWPALSKNP